MAEAVKRLFPEAKLAIGPSIDTGFYYDFEHEPFSRDELDKIEAEMKKIVKEDLKLERFELPRAEAIAFMKEKEEPYKVELIEDLPEDAVISFYRQVEFGDLGKFRLQIVSDGADSAADFKSDTHIKGVNVQYAPGPELYSVFQNMEFVQVASRAVQRVALKAEKEGAKTIDIEEVKKAASKKQNTSGDSSAGGDSSTDGEHTSGGSTTGGSTTGGSTTGGSTTGGSTDGEGSDGDNVNL